MKKNIILLLTMFLQYSMTLAKDWDVAFNQDLNSSSAVTDSFDQIRKLPIKDFEAKIEHDCDQVSKFAKLSINNWSMAKIGKKSEDKAQKYSEMLVKQTVDTQSKLYPFLNDYSVYTELDSISRDIYFTQKNSPDISETFLIDRMIDEIKKKCTFKIISHSKPSSENEINIDLNELEEKKIQSNITSTLINLNQSVPEGSKLTPKDIGTKLNFSLWDLFVSSALMSRDIKNTMKELNQPWYIYEYVLDKKHDEYSNFLRNGGYNRQFAVLTLKTKILSPKSTYMDASNLNLDEIYSLKDTIFTGDRNQIIIWTKLLGYQELDQLN